MAKTHAQSTKWEQLAEAAHYNANELAKLLKRSSRQLRRQFRRHLGSSPQEWLDNLRMLRAPTHLLANRSVKETAANLGYKTAPHFCRQFKDHYKVTASEYIALQAAVQGSSPPQASRT